VVVLHWQQEWVAACRVEGEANMKSSRAKRSLAVRTAVIMVLGVLATTSGATASGEEQMTPNVVRIQDVSGVSPFIGCTANAPSVIYQHGGGRDGEPMIAVNPKDPRNQIAVWMDRTDGNVNTAYTTDGGRTWTQSVPPDVDRCTGNFDRPWEAAGDPWVTFGPDGVAYFSGLTWANFEDPPFSNYVSILHVQTSFDGGATWSLPVIVGHDDYTSDKDSIAADPKRPGTVYATWRNNGFGLVFGAAGASQLLFSKSVDWGHSWSPATVLGAQSVQSNFFGDPQIAALPSGTLVVASSLPTATGGTQLLAFRSTDGGSNWSSGIPILLHGAVTAPPFPICGQDFAPGGDDPGQIATVGENGLAIITLDPAAYAAGNGWQIVLSSSSDGGLTWASSTVIKSSLPITFASVAGTNNFFEERAGLRYGIMWDEMNPSTTNCSAGIEPSRTRFASSDDGRHWTKPITVGAPWWNVFSLYVGDYHSLAATPSGYITVAPEGVALVPDVHNPSIIGQAGIIGAEINVRGSDED
jgi:hypothetical protein